MHCGLKSDVNDFRKCVRSMKLNPFIEYIYWHMNWHTEHHMYAGIPCYNLKKLYKKISNDMPEPRSLFDAWKEMRSTWRKQQIDPSYVFDTPIPDFKINKISDTDEIVNSLGDLRPNTI